MEKNMKKFLAVLFLTLLTSNVYAGGQQTLVTPDGRVLGTASNPLVVTGAGGSIGAQGEDSSVIFNVKTEYGAMGDGIHLFDGNITSGQKTFTSATASFTSADIGKYISIRGAGGSTVDLTALISDVTDSNTITISVAASATVTDVDFVYGTDDTAAIQSAIDAIGNTTNKFGEVFFPAGIYIIGGEFTAANNSQIALPTVSRASGADAPAYTVHMKGASTVTQQTAGNFVGDGGAVIWSVKTTAVDGTYSILSGKSANAADPGNCTQVKLHISDLTFRSVQNPKNSGLNFGNILAVTAERLLIDTAGINNDEMPQPTTSTSYALIMPQVLNGATTLAKEIKTRGFYNGVLLEEHGTLADSLLFYHINGIVFSGNGIDHWKIVTNATIERVKNPLKFIDGISFVDVQVSIESTAGGVGDWSGVTVAVSDASNYGRGIIKYTLVNTSNFNLTGGYYLSLWTPYTQRLALKSSDDLALRLYNSGTASGDTSGSTLLLSSYYSTVMGADGLLGTVSFQGTKDTSRTLYAGAEIKAKASQTWSGTAGGTYMYFSTTPNNSQTKAIRMQIEPNGYIGIGNTAPSGMLVVDPPAAQTIAAGGTIAHDSCGTLKLITAAGAVTTDTTNTFTAPAAGNEGCIMHVCNVGAQNITLDNNANFKSAGGADVVMTADDCVTVGSTGASGVWYQLTALEAN